MLARLDEVSTSQSISWLMANTPLYTAWSAVIILSLMFFSITSEGSTLSNVNCTDFSVCEYSSSTSEANTFKSTRTFSLYSTGTAQTAQPSRGIALCKPPLWMSETRKPYFFISLYMKRTNSLLAFARFLLISSPEWPPVRPLTPTLKKK